MSLVRGRSRPLMRGSEASANLVEGTSRKQLSESEPEAKDELSARPFPTLNERERSEREFSGGNIPKAT